MERVVDQKSRWYVLVFFARRLARPSLGSRQHGFFGSSTPHSSLSSLCCRGCGGGRSRWFCHGCHSGGSGFDLFAAGRLVRFFLCGSPPIHQAICSSGRSWSSCPTRTDRPGECGCLSFLAAIKSNRSVAAAAVAPPPLVFCCRRLRRATCPRPGQLRVESMMDAAFL
jgi:hypothetical protein